MPFVPWPPALVFGYSAHVFASMADRYLEAEIREFAPEVQAEVRATQEALRHSARAWRDAQKTRASAAVGTAAAGEALVPALSDQIGTEELAVMLRCKPRNARNVGAREGLGVMVGGSWVWSRAATLRYLETTEMSA